MGASSLFAVVSEGWLGATPCDELLFLLNCYYCLHGTRSRYFGQAPPTLEDYIRLDEILDPPPAAILEDVWEMD